MSRAFGFSGISILSSFSDVGEWITKSVLIIYKEIKALLKKKNHALLFLSVAWQNEFCFISVYTKWNVL